MKTLIPFCVMFLLLFSCDDDSVERVVLRIKENTSTCSDFAGPRQCLLVQQGNKIGTDDWNLFYDPISGFEYEPGYIYKLVVSKKHLENPPMDASSFRYKLIDVISKEPKP